MHWIYGILGFALNICQIVISVLALIFILVRNMCSALFKLHSVAKLRWLFTAASWDETPSTQWTAKATPFGFQLWRDERNWLHTAWRVATGSVGQRLRGCRLNFGEATIYWMTKQVAHLGTSSQARSQGYIGGTKLPGCPPALATVQTASLGIEMNQSGKQGIYIYIYISISIYLSIYLYILC